MFCELTFAEFALVADGAEASVILQAAASVRTGSVRSHVTNLNRARVTWSGGPVAVITLDRVRIYNTETCKITFV